LRLGAGAIAVSALTGAGLCQRCRWRSTHGSQKGNVTVGYNIPTSDGAQLAWLYDHGEVISRQDGEEAVHVTVRLTPDDRARFERQHLDARAPGR
jgi:GTP-binding protein HflX